MLSCKKVFVDTKFKTVDSVSNSNFKIELPETVYCPENTVAFIDDIAIPHAWYTIEENLNDKVYIDLYDVDLDVHYYIKAQIEDGNKTGALFASDLASALNTATNPIDNEIFTSEYYVRENKLKLFVNYPKYNFNILTPTELASSYNGLWTITDPAYDRENPHDINEILNNLGSVSLVNSDISPYESGYLNLQSIRNIYIHSANLGNYKNFGPGAQRTSIKKVPVVANFNEMIFDNVLISYDFIDVSHSTLKTIEFSIKDARGNYIPLRGANLSFSIVFAKQNPNI